MNTLFKHLMGGGYQNFLLSPVSNFTDSPSLIPQSQGLIKSQAKINLKTFQIKVDFELPEFDLHHYQNDKITVTIYKGNSLIASKELESNEDYLEVDLPLNSGFYRITSSENSAYNSSEKNFHPVDDVWGAILTPTPKEFTWNITFTLDNVDSYAFAIYSDERLSNKIAVQFSEKTYNNEEYEEGVLEYTAKAYSSIYFPWESYYPGPVAANINGPDNNYILSPYNLTPFIACLKYRTSWLGSNIYNSLNGEVVYGKDIFSDSILHSPNNYYKIWERYDSEQLIAFDIIVMCQRTYESIKHIGIDGTMEYCANFAGVYGSFHDVIYFDKNPLITYYEVRLNPDASFTLTNGNIIEPSDFPLYITPKEVTTLIRSSDYYNPDSDIYVIPVPDSNYDSYYVTTDGKGNWTFSTELVSRKFDDEYLITELAFNHDDYKHIHVSLTQDSDRSRFYLYYPFTSRTTYIDGIPNQSQELDELFFEKASLVVINNESGKNITGHVDAKFYRQNNNAPDSYDDNYLGLDIIPTVAGSIPITTLGFGCMPIQCTLSIDDGYNCVFQDSEGVDLGKSIYIDVLSHAGKTYTIVAV